MELIFIGVLVALVVYVLSLRVVVPTNEIHIIQRGSKTISYGKDMPDKMGNVYYQFPAWLPIIGITKTVLPCSVFDVTLECYEAYDIGRLPFVVDIKAFFRINDSNVAASRISSFDELIGQITDIVRGAVRSIMANSKLEDIMGERSKYGVKFTEAVELQLAEWGVVPVKNIELMDVRDAKTSNVIANIMAKKSSEIEKESRIEVATNIKLARQAEIEAEQDVRLKDEEAKQAVGKKEAEVQREVGLANELSQQEIKSQAKVTKEKEMEVLKVQQIKQAEIDKEAYIIDAEREKSALVIQAEANARQAELIAEGSKKAIELKAEADLVVELKKAQGIEANGKASAEAKRLMELAPVNAQITLAKEIGNNQGYQNYLVKLEQIKALCEVGIEQAKNLGKADIKINALSNDVPTGVSKITDVFSPKGAMSLSGALETLGATEKGQMLLDGINAKLKQTKKKEA